MSLPEDDDGLDLIDLLRSGDITTSYWFNSDGLQEVAEIHTYLESLPETGKVLSVHTGMQILQALNGDKPYSDFKLAVVYKRVPEEVKDALITPYLSADGNQIRFSIRIYESDKSLKRQVLIDKINNYLTTEFGLGSRAGQCLRYGGTLQ